MRRILLILLPLIIIGGGVAMIFVLAANKPEPEASDEERPALAAFAERLERRDLNLTVTAQGEVRPRSEISVTPQVAGRISYISNSFVDGGFIGKGQIIARLDEADYQLAVVRAKSVVAAAQQSLVREEAEAEVALKDLQDLGIADSSPLARREPQLLEAQAALDSAYAQLSEANLALERTVIRAPFDARVRTREVDIGQFVATGQNLGRIFSTDMVEVPLPLTDDQLGRLNLPLAFAETKSNPGPEVTFTTVVGGKEREWTGRITRTAAAVNNQSRLINVFGEVQDPYGAGADGDAPMAPGLFVTAKIAGETIEDVIWAPRAALRGNNELYIGNLEEGTLSIRSVTPIFADENGAYFEDGAFVGELAIVSPIQAAFDGMKLTIRERRPDGTFVETDKTPADVALTSGTETAQ